MLTATVKVSILMLYRRIFFSVQARWFQIAWWTNLFLGISVGLVLLILGVAGCSPHPLSERGHKTRSCQNDLSSAAIMGFMNAASDFLIYVLPLRVCWSLQLSRQRRLGVCAVFGLSLMYVSPWYAKAWYFNPQLTKGLAQSRSVSPALSQSPPVGFPKVCERTFLNLCKFEQEAEARLCRRSKRSSFYHLEYHRADRGLDLCLSSHNAPTVYISRYHTTLLHEAN